MWNKIMLYGFLAFCLLPGCAKEDYVLDEKIEITIGEHIFLVEVARAREEKRQGLMFRDTLEENRGMLFVYDRYVKIDRVRGGGGFWMKNVKFPLSIAFLSDDGKILDIKDMAAGSEKTIYSRFSYMYALEVNKGAFAKRNIKVGDKVIFPEGFK